MLAIPDHEDFLDSKQSEADKHLLVRFFIKEREDKEGSLREGRPIFKETEYVEIRIPGKRDAQACRPATPRDRQRFPQHYKMFKDRVEAPAEGTPLSEWPQISRSMVEHLSFLHIKTVEQLSTTSDGDLSNIHGAMSLKARAGQFLKNADTTKLIAEKEQLEDRLKANEETLAEMQKTMERMQAALADKALAATAPEPAPIDEESAAPKTRRPRRGAASEE